MTIFDVIRYQVGTTEQARENFAQLPKQVRADFIEWYKTYPSHKRPEEPEKLAYLRKLLLELP